ncbi:M20 family metallopeptidase [Leisingera sp. ANG-M1]|uniref:M20 family metallopeptidase n=1 Tax=Leisingera sp. ANG-M1 TaxID=1577895 RepID=UPI0006894E57|nr:M20/M25/M40 family metallo-hydrolase [Leisingera sp. ANG-M1]
MKDLMMNAAPDATRLADTLIELVRIQSVNPFDEAPGPGRREQEMAEDLLARFHLLGLETGWREVEQGRPNIWGRLKGTGGGPAIMLAAHMDTVGTEGYGDAFDARLVDGKVTGRGSCDMKGAFACYLEVIRMLQASGTELPGDLIIAGIADEEHLLTGSAEMGRNGPGADFGIIGEPSKLAICPSHKGQLGAMIRTYGVATHSSGPENGVNAVEHMGAVIAHLSGLNAELQQNPEPHPLCGTGRFSMNVIRGGAFVSGIPDYCEMEIDRRFLPGEDPEEILEDYRRRLRELKKELPDLKAEVSGPSLLAPALNVPQDSAVVAALTEAARGVLGREPEITAFPGGTDAPNLGFPCVICGPGDLAQAHSTDEYIEVKQLVQASSIYLQTVLKMNGQG